MNILHNKRCITLILIIFTLPVCLQLATPLSITDQSVDFVIISPESFSNELQPLITHKNNKMISTVLITKENILSGNWPVGNVSIGRDDAETIKFCISELVREWNTNYVLLAGGKEFIPIRFARNNFDQQTLISSILRPRPLNKYTGLVQQMDRYISDLYYADLFFENGSFCSWDSNENMRFAEKNQDRQIDIVDIYPDVAIGRLLCTTKEEIRIVVDKIIEYESDLIEDDDWKNNITVCGGDTHSLWRDILIKFVYNNQSNVKIAYEGEYLGDKAAKILSEYDVAKVYTTQLLEENTLFVTRENINKAINQGCSFLLLAGHGYPQAWGTHPPSLFGKIWVPGPIFDPLLYRSEDINGLTNSKKLPVAIISACSCGDFTETSDPIAWKFIEYEHGGAIASFACTTLGTLFPTTLTDKTLNGKLALGVIESYDQGNSYVGDLWRDSITMYLDDAEAMELGELMNNFWLNQFNLEEWILFGDPTLEIK